MAALLRKLVIWGTGPLIALLVTWGLVVKGCQTDEPSTWEGVVTDAPPVPTLPPLDEAGADP